MLKLKNVRGFKIKKILNINYYLKKIYNKIMDYSKGKYASVILAIVAFTESSFFLIPPDVFIISMVFANGKKFLKIAMIATLFSVLGGIFGYIIGYFLYDAIAVSIIEKFHLQMSIEKFKMFYDKYGMLSVFIAGFTPIPYKVATILSGFLHMNIYYFVLISVLSRGIRFFLVATLIKIFEEKAKKFIESHLGWVSLIIVVVIIGIFVIIKKIM